MPHYLDGVINQYGKPVPALTVAVYQPGTLTFASVYSDELVTLKSNPFKSDATGMIDFYAVSGAYDLALSGGSPAINPLTFMVNVGGGSGTGVTQSKTASTGSIAAGSAASVTVTWDTPFGNANYKFAVSLLESVAPGQGGLRILQTESISTTALIVRVINDDDTLPHTGTIYALAF